jgi:predicted ATPase/transcriptional regulator with XRE-family HTH domain
MVLRVATTFGDLLRQYRLAAGLTQEELAARAQVSPRAISDLERAQRTRPWRDTVQLLAQALQLSPVDRTQLEAAARVPQRSASSPAHGQAELPVADTPQISRGRRPSNLPAQLTPLIGREAEVTAIIRLLRSSSVRLVTLTGPGGIGKTRLALEIASQLIDDFAGDVILVRLEALANADLVGPSIAQSLGLRPAIDQSPWESLQAYLREQRLLLVIDNFEQVLEAASDIVELLADCPALKILATSRTALHLAGEHEYLVPPLGFAKLTSGLSLADATRSAAAQLFVERARAVRTGFAVTEANARSIARICEQLDGVPLAIELAASLAKALPVDSLAERLTARFQLLARPAHLGQARQQTLQATFDWSFNLLTDPERSLFRRLAVFTGGFTLEAAEAVCGDVAGPVTSDLVLPLLIQLVDKSLVVLRDDGGVRYHLLQPIRQYALGRLEQAGERQTFQGRHADWCVDLAEYTEWELWAANQVQVVETLRSERENIRTALAWCIDEHSPLVVRLAGHLAFYWYTFSETREGRYWIELALEQPTDDRLSRGKVTLGLGFILRDSEGSFARSRSLTEESLALFRELGDRRLCGWALNNLGNIALYEGQHNQARVLLEESIAEFEAVGDDAGAGASWRDLSQAIHHLGDDEAASRAIAESLSLLRRVGDSMSLSITLNICASLALHGGDLAQARQLANEALLCARTIQSDIVEAMDREVLARIARAEGNPVEARAHLTDALILKRRWGYDLQTWDCLLQLGANRLDREQLAAGVRLVGAAYSRVAKVDVEVMSNEGLTAGLTRARTILGNDGYARAWSDGEAMTLEQAMADALEEASS